MKNRMSLDQGQQNLAVARKIALTLLKSNSSKLSIKMRKYKSSLDINYLSEIIGVAKI